MRLPTLAPGALLLAAGLLLAGFLAPAPAHAYVDPVSGSIILQVVAAGALATVFTFKRFTAKLREAARSLWKLLRRA